MSMLDQVSIKPAPDFNRLLKVLRLKGEPDRVPFYELFADKPLKDKIMGKQTLLPALLPIGEMDEIIKNDIEFWYRLGYDFVPTSPVYFFSTKFKLAPDTTEVTLGARLWLTEECTAQIGTREQFQEFAFAPVEQIDYTWFDRVGKFLPEGMKVIAMTTGGVLENTMWLMSHTGMAYAMTDDPELVKMVFDKVGETLLLIIEQMLQRDFVGAIAMGDDMGFKTSTMISPADMRRYVFPWQKKAVELTHKYGKPFILHSCGNLTAIMDDLIDDVGIDAKHSFEDLIMPLPEVKRRWGKRVAVLGGVDMNFLARAAPDDVRAYTRRLIRECAPGGGFALGTGNTVANYLPAENYLAMLEEGWKAGKYPIEL